MDNDTMAALLQLKRQKDQGLISLEEFNVRRVALIDQATGTTGSSNVTKIAAAQKERSRQDASDYEARYGVPLVHTEVYDARGNLTNFGNNGAPQPQPKPQAPHYMPQAAREGMTQDVYADAHFAQTNQASLKAAAYYVITTPKQYNQDLFVPNAQPVMPYSQFGGNATHIDPTRGQNPVVNSKVVGDTTVVYVDTTPGQADRDELIKKLEEDKKKLSWELFHAATVNDVPRIKELLDRGADVNQRDYDTEATPIICAAERGQKHAVYYMVERGADVNAQNFRGETALHAAVKMKFNEMALWLTKRGADIQLENFRGYTAYDLALPWLQKELKDEYDHFIKEEKKKRMMPQQVYHQQPASGMAGLLDQDLGGGGGGYGQPGERNSYNPYGAGGGGGMDRGTMGGGGGYSRDTMAPGASGLTAAGAAAGGAASIDDMYGATRKNVPRPDPTNVAIMEAQQQQMQSRPPAKQEVMKIYLKNGSYKSLLVTSDHNARNLCDLMAEKLNMMKFANYLDVHESVKDVEKRMDPAANIMAAKKKWPLILGPAGNETDKQCKFIVVCKRGTPENIAMAYRDAIYGGQA